MPSWEKEKQFLKENNNTIMDFRIEKDTMGEVKVPADALYRRTNTTKH